MQVQQYIQKYLILLLPQNNTNRNSIYWKGCFSRWFLLLVSSGSKGSCGDLVVQWLWVCLAMQGTWVQSLFRELRSAGQRSPHSATETWCCQKKKKKRQFWCSHLQDTWSQADILEELSCCLIFALILLVSGTVESTGRCIVWTSSLGNLDFLQAGCCFSKCQIFILSHFKDLTQGHFWPPKPRFMLLLSAFIHLSTWWYNVLVF